MATTTNRPINTARVASAPRALNTQAPVAAPCCCPACKSLECLDRPRYFAGQLLTEADLNNEQSYWLAKNRLHNRYLVGWGVVCGMQVVCSECDGWVTVKSGYALDPCGNDIIICGDQAFNLLKAIQACCTPPKQANCAPPRPAPPPACQDAQQKWCITIQYQEQPTRPVAPLQQPSSKKKNCGCGGSSANGTSNGTSCCCSSTTTQTTSATTATACEPTRIFEGFKLGVCPAPQPSDQKQQTPSPGTAAYQAYTCIQTLEKLILQTPNFAQHGVTDPNTAYSQACNFLLAVRNYLAKASLTRCQILDDFNAFKIPKPGQQNPNDYISAVQNQVNLIVQSLASTALDCICLALMPACPPDPCDNCLILACVTVQNGQIVDICHFGGGRQQVVTFPALYYWLASFGLENALGVLIAFLERLCCGETDQRANSLGSAFAPAENFSTAGITNAAMVNRILSSVVTQNLGATIVNQAVPTARTLDLQPLVGQNLETVSRTLEAYKIQVNKVEAGPAWTDDVIAQSAQFAPAAFPAGQQLTVFTKNQLVVGFESTSPTDSLKLQVAALQAQVTALQNQINPQGPSPSGRRSGRG